MFNKLRHSFDKAVPNKVASIKFSSKETLPHSSLKFSVDTIHNGSLMDGLFAPPSLLRERG